MQTASRALKLTQANYKAGIATCSDVLIADAQYFQARLVVIQARAARYQDTVALFAAFGGGWWNETYKTTAMTLR
jgi:outer membrane protein TolC